MKNRLVVSMGIAALLVSGCSHTLQGVQQDAKDNAPAAQAAAQQADQALSQADQVTSKVVSSTGVKLAKLDHEADIALLTPEIKADIIADKDFDTKTNVVHVTSNTTGVYLQGHVISQSLKSKASQIASSVIAKRAVQVGLHDELTVVPG